MENTSFPALALRGKMIYPDTSAFFEVSRAKSLKALEEAVNHNQLIFLVNQRDPAEETPSEEDLFQVGTIARIQQMVKAGQGILRVFVEGVGRAKILDYQDVDPCPWVIVERINSVNFPEGENDEKARFRLICDLLGRDLADALERFLAFLIFAAAMILATVLEKRTDWDLRLPAVFLDMAAAIAIGFIPAKADPVVALYPVFAATAFQWCVFKSAGGYAASTIFCTNNLRQTVVSLTEYLLLSREERKGGGETLKKACMFGGTLASFYSGVLIGGILWHLTGVRSIWFNLLLLSCSALLIGADRRAQAG